VSAGGAGAGLVVEGVHACLHVEQRIGGSGEALRGARPGSQRQRAPQGRVVVDVAAQPVQVEVEADVPGLPVPPARPRAKPRDEVTGPSSRQQHRAGSVTVRHEGTVVVGCLRERGDQVGRVQRWHVAQEDGHRSLRRQCAHPGRHRAVEPDSGIGHKLRAQPGGEGGHPRVGGHDGEPARRHTGCGRRQAVGGDREGEVFAPDTGRGVQPGLGAVAALDRDDEVPVDGLAGVHRLDRPSPRRRLDSDPGTGKDAHAMPRRSGDQ
jgi:hypothetical protein